jgi:hypothetical protein
MDSETKTDFCRQLAKWAEIAIERGRYPFRRVEVSPPLLTAEGQMTPDLVFWINRGSFMTGGLLLVPDRETEDLLAEGRQCAAALGIRHFVVWSQRSVHIWEDGAEQLRCLHRFSLPALGKVSANDFQAVLGKVLEEMKLLAVLGAIPAEQLSPYYLANLCHYTLQQAHPVLEDAFRQARGENRLTDDLSPAVLAERRSLLTLWRLLALISHDLLPMSVQPEGLERAMHFALDGLPPWLAEILRQPSEDLPLPTDGAVLFHSLCRRLMQLPGCKEHERAVQVLAILLQTERGQLGGFPPPPVSASEAYPLWLLYPDHPEVHTGDFVEIAPSSYLAGAALWRDLGRRVPPVATASDIFALPELPPPVALRGTLSESHPIATPLRHQYKAMLRLSWPTRRFNLPAHTPRWMWECLHLLGHAAPQASFDLQLPSTWLTADYGSTFFDLLRGHFSIELLEGDPQGLLRMRFCKSDQPQRWTTFAGPNGTRQRPWAEMRTQHRALMLLNLALPEKALALLDSELLSININLAPKSRPGAELFIRSALGNWLWTLVSAGRPLPTSATLPDAMARHGLPCPSDEVLQALQLACSETEGPPPAGRIDQELGRLLGPLPPLKTPISRRKPSPPNAPPITAQSLSVEELVHAVFVDGIPRFPEQYLYNYYRPKMQTFSFTGPLSVGNEFFGRITLFDTAGAAIEVEDPETAMALQFASHSAPSPVLLPTDRQICAEITERYRADLLRLRQELLRRTHLAASESRAADLLAKRVWRGLPLPDWAILDIKDRTD